MLISIFLLIIACISHAHVSLCSLHLLLSDLSQLRQDVQATEEVNRQLFLELVDLRNTEVFIHLVSLVLFT